MLRDDSIQVNSPDFAWSEAREESKINFYENKSKIFARNIQEINEN